MKPTSPTLRLLLLGALALALAPPTTRAQGDARTRSAIRDDAGMFDREALHAAEDELARIERATGVPVLIETVESLKGQAIDDASLRRARESGLDGVYVLIAKAETKIYVRVHRDLARDVTDAARTAIQDEFIGGFKRGDFNAGLKAGVAAIGQALSRVQPRRGSPAAPASGRPATPRSEAFEPLRPGAEPGTAPAAGGPSDLIVRNQARLTLAGAREILAGAEAKAAEMGLKVNIAVVDDGGHPLAFARMDGARPASGYTAQTKAVTAATFRQSTGPLPPGADQPDVLLNLSLQNAAAAGGGRLTTLYGGVPVTLDGQVLGGVGVGGGTGEQDAQVARAGIARLMQALGGGPGDQK